VMMENAIVCSRERWKLPWFMTFLLISSATWSDVNTEGWRSAASFCKVQAANHDFLQLDGASSGGGRS